MHSENKIAQEQFAHFTKICSHEDVCQACNNVYIKHQKPVLDGINTALISHANALKLTFPERPHITVIMAKNLISCRPVLDFW